MELMMRSIRTVKSSERKLSRAAVLKRFKSRQIKAWVIENPAGCPEKGVKLQTHSVVSITVMT